MSLLRILLPAYPMIPSPMWILSTMIPSPIVTVFVTGCNAFVTPRNGGITPRVACNGFLWVSARERCLRATPALLALLKIVPLMLGPSLPNWQVGTNDGIVPLMLGPSIGIPSAMSCGSGGVGAIGGQRTRKDTHAYNGEFLPTFCPQLCTNIAIFINHIQYKIGSIIGFS